MSEPQKQPEKKPFLTKRVILFLVAVIIIGSFAYAILNIYYPNPESEIAQQSPPSVIPTTVDIPMSKENFDRCVELTIDMVKIFPYEDNKSVEDTLDDDVMDLRTEWKLLGCPSVESLITETNEWIHRNDSP